MQSVKGDVCGVENCRAVQYYTEDGLWFCKNGHQSAVGLFQFSDRRAVSNQVARVVFRFRKTKITSEPKVEGAAGSARYGKKPLKVIAAADSTLPC